MKYIFNFSSINLGCNKNLVDTQFLLGRILWFNTLNSNYEVNYFANPDETEVEYIFVNTCGFLSSGRKEMMDTLQKLINDGKKPIVLGCWVQYFQTLDKNNAPELLKNISLLSWGDLDKITVLDIIKGYSSQKFEEFEFNNNVRAYTNSIYSFEYVKIAEWCNNNCSFCIIPKIRGKQKSIAVEKVLSEVENMVKSGIQEIIILSQDTTRYWIDLYGKPAMFELLEKLEELPYDFKYRLLYLYPDIVTLKQLEKLKTFKKFIPYFDIPLQHISSNVLKRMWRFYDSEYISQFLEFIDKNFETRFVRTNIIVWFPWETDSDFAELKEFLEKWYFDNVALFEYHDEPMADSSKLDNKVDDKTISERFNILRKIVDDKLEFKELSKKWTQQEWFVMDILENTLMVRPWLNAPEIDSYDEVPFELIRWVYNDDWEVDIGTKIIYIK